MVAGCINSNLITRCISIITNSEAIALKCIVFKDVHSTKNNKSLTKLHILKCYIIYLLSYCLKIL